MYSCKSLVILLLLIAVSVGQSNDYIPCQPVHGDILLASVRFSRSRVSRDYVSATRSINVGNNIISCVHAHDEDTVGTGGSADVVEGGAGHNHVDVEITSQYNKGFRFLIEVFGRPVTCKYLRKCCVNFRTCTHIHTHTHTHTHTHKHHNCGYTTFYPKILSA